MTEKELWMVIRSAILLVADAIERKFNIAPRTSELRKHDGYFTSTTTPPMPYDKED